MRVAALLLLGSTSAIAALTPSSLVVPSAMAPFSTVLSRVACTPVVPRVSWVAVRLPALAKPAHDGEVQLIHESQLDPLLQSLDLHADEVTRLGALQPERKLTFAGGRVAVRRAMELLDADGGVGGGSELRPVLSSPIGAPLLPGGWLGSITHTGGLAVAAVAEPPLNAGGPFAVGIDVEHESRPTSPRLASRILSVSERATLGAQPGLGAPADALLRFSVKEALYKALHPLVCARIPWLSVSVQPRADGSCAVGVSELEAATGTRLRAHASWERHEGYFIATAAAALLDAPRGASGQA